jgi:hypothetical protein
LFGIVENNFHFLLGVGFYLKCCFKDAVIVLLIPTLEIGLCFFDWQRADSNQTPAIEPRSTVNEPRSTITFKAKNPQRYGRGLLHFQKKPITS